MDTLQVRKDARIPVERDIAAYELSLHAIEVHGDAAIVYYTVTTTSSRTEASVHHTYLD